MYSNYIYIISICGCCACGYVLWLLSLELVGVLMSCSVCFYLLSFREFLFVALLLWLFVAVGVLYWLFCLMCSVRRKPLFLLIVCGVCVFACSVRSSCV